jgi:nitrite reductase/ring-hydroxylating ferredoxin subunit
MRELPDGWVDGGAVTDLPDGGCAAAAGERVLLVRHGNEVLAFENRCLHQDTPLHEGYVTDGTLVCPLHFWRYRLEDGRVVGRDSRLRQLPVQVSDGRIAVRPPPIGPTSMSELMRRHARSWSREDPPVQPIGRSANHTETT